MKVVKSPGAVAAHGASETDELGRHVTSENSFRQKTTQATISAAPAQRGDAGGVRANRDGALEEQPRPDALRIIIEPTKNGRKWTTRIGDRVLGVAAAPFVKSARLLLAEGCRAETIIEMWRPGTDTRALRGWGGTVASVVRRILAGLYGTPPTVTRLSLRRIGISIAANHAWQESRERVA